MPDNIESALKEVNNAVGEMRQANEANLKKYDGLLTDKVTKIQDALDAADKRAAASEAQQKAIQEQLDNVEKALNRPGAGNKDAAMTSEYKSAVERMLRKPAAERDPQDAEVVRKYVATLVKGDDAGAGYLQAPPDMIRDIMKDVVETSPFRTLATVRMIGGPSLKRPRRTATAGLARRVGELEKRVNTGDPAYAIMEYQAPEMYARGEISVQMLEDMDYDLVAELRSEWAEQFALKEGQEFLNGDNAANQAEGILKNAKIGEINSGDATKITADGLITLYYALKNPYARVGTWAMNRSTIRDIRLLKDLNGVYIWQPGITGTVPSTILSATYTELPDMPNVAAGMTPVLFGDFKKAYVVVDRVAMSFSTDFTTAADDGIVIYRARKRVGGGVMQDEAVKKLKIAA